MKGKLGGSDLMAKRNAKAEKRRLKTKV